MFFLILMLLFTVLYLFLFSFIDLSYYFYFLWTFLSILGSVITVVLLALLYIALAPTKNYKNAFKHFLLYEFCDLALILFHIKVEVIGKENIPTDTTKFVIVSNHKSQMDPVILYRVLKLRCSALGKKDLFKHWPLTKLAKIYRAIPIDRDNDKAALKQIIEAIKLVKNNYPLIIFPEGGIKTRETEEMVAVRPGAYKVPLKANGGILPISIIGSSKMKGKPIFKKIKIKVVIHKYFSYEEIKDLNTITIGDNIEQIINNCIKEENS